MNKLNASLAAAAALCFVASPSALADEKEPDFPTPFSSPSPSPMDPRAGQCMRAFWEALTSDKVNPDDILRAFRECLNAMEGDSDKPQEFDQPGVDV